MYSFYTGMLSKSKGQVLRVAACLHVMFYDDTIAEPGNSLTRIPSTISKEVIIAAMNFVDTCVQHAAFMAGRDLIEEEISRLISGTDGQLLWGCELTVSLHSKIHNYSLDI